MIASTILSPIFASVDMWKSCFPYNNTNLYFLRKIYIRKGNEAGLYQNKVSLSLTLTQRLGHSAHNCKMATLAQYH